MPWTSCNLIPCYGASSLSTHIFVSSDGVQHGLYIQTAKLPAMADSGPMVYPLFTPRPSLCGGLRLYSELGVDPGILRIPKVRVLNAVCFLAHLTIMSVRLAMFRLFTVAI